jgi:hypothetical protein
MKRLLVLACFAAVIIAMQFAANCSDPLETINSRNLTPVGPDIDTVIHYDTVVVIDTLNHVDSVIVIDTVNYVDTVIVVDTTNQIDTLFITDTTFVVDTIIVRDTTNHVDTVIIVEPGQDGPQMLCAQMASNRQEILWMYRNPEGLFRLEFAASTERGHPTQELLVEIDGRLIIWDTSDSLELILEQNLGPNAKIRISSLEPHAFGHAIDICLTLTKL